MKRLNWIGICITSLAIGFIVYVNIAMEPGAKKKVDATKEPISQDSIAGICLEGYIHWEVINDSLFIYTEEDSIIDEQKRWEYIQWIENQYEEEEWEKMQSNQGVCKSNKEGWYTVVLDGREYEISEDNMTNLWKDTSRVNEWIHYDLEVAAGDSWMNSRWEEDIEE